MPLSLKVYDACHFYPSIDNHAHPILAEQHREAFAFEGVISEAQGSALTNDSVHTLACLRVIPKLGAILNIQNPTWESIKAARSNLPYADLCNLFMHRRVTGIQCMLLDDGLGGVEEFAEGYKWHDQFGSSPTKRIVRVEIVAEDILKSLFKPDPTSADLPSILDSFNTTFIAHLNENANDENVVGFKSIACYRTGLDIAPAAESETSILACLKDVLQTYQTTGKLRLAHKSLNDSIVRMALTISGECGKPVQFHTGLGDNDITLNRSSPSHMQAIIKVFPKTLFVLLHSAYPYTRDAGYLTAVYPNVFLDFGEVFPFVSGAGQRSIIQQVLELCPTNKILWSTDGHWWPESYYFGSVQAREALFEVLNDYVSRSELLESDAVTIAQNALFHNANNLYNLSLTPNLDIFERAK
ncbi:amidohydrolase-domain-containing protein [Mycena metata]|uniref:Amidohydrolase-domain-containing protein n=1 Tax=Mycena metata TaxID=1033252 RepID=A0AAD7NFV5_9AGAR|nr:amidohydrolase-domain-containing protein [Mycena metata]